MENEREIIEKLAAIEHVTMMHLRFPTQEEKEPLDLNNDGSPKEQL